MQPSTVTCLIFRPVPSHLPSAVRSAVCCWQLRERLRRVVDHDQGPVLVHPTKEEVLSRNFETATSARGKRPAFAKATAWLVDSHHFGGGRIDDLFEARIAAQRVPEKFYRR